MFVVIDLENTISNSSDRMWMLRYNGESQTLNEHYKKQFQEAFMDDFVNENVKLFMDSLKGNPDNVVVILTAKLDKYRDLVEGWLEHYQVKYDVLVMKSDETMTDLGYKEKYVSLNKENIDFALDDVGAMCAMFGKYNIPCLRIEQK